jgi:hypothetical protein
MASRIGWSNLLTVAGVTITSSSEATGHADDHLASRARWKDWRSGTSTGDQWVKFDLGANNAMTLLAIVDATIHAGGTVKAQAHTSDSWATPTIDVTLTIPSPDYTGVRATYFASQNLRWVRFYFTNTVAVSSYVQLGAAFAGTYLEPSAGIAPGLVMQRVDPSLQRYAIGGARSTVRRSKYHNVNGVWRLQTAAARDSLRTAFESMGATEPVIFAPDHSLPGSLTFYGHFVPALTSAHFEQSADQWSMPFAFEEDRS